MLDKNKEILKDFAKQYNFDYRILLAIGMKESGLIHIKDSVLIHRFEPAIFNGFVKAKSSGKKFPALPSLNPSWIQLHTVEQLKLMSTSYGIFQIMAWHYYLLDYDTPDNMVDDWEVEELHARDFCLFCVRYREGNFLKALQKLDYDTIALMYNGAGYKKNNYSESLKKNLASIV